MWILLQFISIASSGLKQKAQASSNLGGQGVMSGGGGVSAQGKQWGLDAKGREQVTAIFNALYPPDAEMAWAGCAEEDSIDMVRFFAAPAIYIHLTHNQIDGAIEAPPEKVQTYIEFLKGAVFASPIMWNIV